MVEFHFEALGTAWTILVDGVSDTEVTDLFWQSIIDATTEFDQQLSRFIPTSEAVRFRNSPAGTYSVSERLFELLMASDKLRSLTNGAYDPAMGTLLERTAYDDAYTFSSDADKVQRWQLPKWSLEKSKRAVTIDGPIVFDIGGTGKGYWIDAISHMLLQHNLAYHLVDGGGDMMATTKADGSSWNIALEWPGRVDTALGSVKIANQGFAGSDVFRRRWGEWHHLLSIEEKKPITAISGCFAIAKNAWVADQMTSALSLSKATEYTQIAAALHAEYVFLSSDGSVITSPGWPGELFT